MVGVSRSFVGLAVVAMVASAAFGLYFGFSRTTAAPGAASSDTSTVTTATVAAKTASAIPDSAPVAPVPDETFIRKIAREEVQSALHPKRTTPKPDADDGSDTSDDTAADSHGPPMAPVNVSPAPLAVPPAPQ